MQSRAHRTPPQSNPGRGMKPEWANLPRRRCDNCGKQYKPKQPLRKTQQYGFCKKECKDQFHKHGAAFIQLREKIAGEVARQVKDLEKRVREIVREEIAAARVNIYEVADTGAEFATGNFTGSLSPR